MSSPNTKLYVFTHAPTKAGAKHISLSGEMDSNDLAVINYQMSPSIIRRTLVKLGWNRYDRSGSIWRISIPAPPQGVDAQLKILSKDAMWHWEMSAEIVAGVSGKNISLVEDLLKNLHESIVGHIADSLPLIVEQREMFREYATEFTQELSRRLDAETEALDARIAKLEPPSEQPEDEKTAEELFTPRERELIQQAARAAADQCMEEA